MNIHEYMRECQDKRYEWGKFDCCTFAAGAIEVATGVDVMAPYRTYIDEMSCAITMNENFGSTNIRDAFLKLAATVSGKAIDIAEARDGDVVCIQWPLATYNKGKVDQRQGMGVFYRYSAWACLCPQGITRIPLTHRIIDVWRF